MRVRLRNGYTQAYAQKMQHTHTHKAVTGRVEAKNVLSRRRQSNYSGSSNSRVVVAVTSDIEHEESGEKGEGYEEEDKHRKGEEKDGDNDDEGDKINHPRKG